MLDRVELQLKAGDGGRGAITFRREKFIPYGGPFGGDGGKGGHIIIKADENMNTLRAYKYKRSFKSENGGAGMTKNKHGKNGESLTLGVPPGTLVYLKSDSGSLELLADLEIPGQEVIVAHGGNGGYGNLHYVTATNQAPRIAQPGIQGQKKSVVLELRLIAEVGIIGYPNVGKSSLLAAVSRAKPEIADYPFTTLEPILGVVDVEGKSFIMAEIPGLIEGAHSGKGLGHHFLRHAMRTLVMIHLLNGASPSPLDDMIRVNNELALFDASLAKRPQVIAINKVDLPEVQARVEELKTTFSEAGLTPLFISAAGHQGLDELVAETWKILQPVRLKAKLTQSALEPAKVFHPQAVDTDKRIHREGNRFILAESSLEVLLDKLDLDDPSDLKEFNDALESKGINKSLKAAGVKSGDTVITGKMEWTWTNDEDRSSRGHI
jgi:GTP-binding protein